MTEPADVLSHLAEQERQRILSMEAGRDLDAEIERVVFERPVYPCNDGTGDWLIGRPGSGDDDYIIPPYSSDPGAAWLVVERLPGCCTEITRENVAGVRYDVTINLDETHTRTFHVMAGTMPLAVARASLLAALPNDSTR